MFIENRRASQKTTTASMAGQGLCRLRVNLGRGAGGRQASCPRRRPYRHGLPEPRQGGGCRRESFWRAPRRRSTSVIADFSDLETVRAAAEILLRDYPRIDVLINSAGLYSTTRTTTRDGFETVFCVNHLAPFLLTYLLLERLKQSAPARIIQVNSEGHRFGGLDLDDLNWEHRRYNGYRGYGASKIAQLLTTWEFADRLQGTGVTINAMHPGDVRTNIGNNNGPLYRWFQHIVIWHYAQGPGHLRRGAVLPGCRSRTGGRERPLLPPDHRRETGGPCPGPGDGPPGLGCEPAVDRPYARSLRTRSAASLPVRMEIGSPDGL